MQFSPPGSNQELHSAFSSVISSKYLLCISKYSNFSFYIFIILMIITAWRTSPIMTLMVSYLSPSPRLQLQGKMCLLQIFHSAKFTFIIQVKFCPIIYDDEGVHCSACHQRCEGRHGLGGRFSDVPVIVHFIAF